MQYTLVIEDRNGIIADELSFEHGSYTIGRGDTNDIQLASNAVSREHARVFTESGRCFVADLRSSNGVFVDGNRIFGTQEVVAGSQIRIGDFFLLLQRRGLAGQATASPDVPAQATITLPRLIRIGDMLDGETYSLTQQHNTVGRTEDNTVLLADASVSRRHATVSIDGGRFILVDNGSSNGTRINNHLILEPALLTAGDVISFGNIRFVFAVPGQHIDLTEYKRFLGGSNRGLVIAVTVLALLLVLVASGIGAFVLLDDKSDQTEEELLAPTVSPEERARTLKTDGDTRAAAQDWNSAIVQYGLALDFDPTYREAADALEHAQLEFEAWRHLEEAEINVRSGQQLAREENHQSALRAYEQARDLLLQIPETSRYSEAARGQIGHEIAPSMVRFHRQLGDADLARQQFDPAISHFRTVIEILELHSGSETPGMTRENRETFRLHLLSAAATASEATIYPSAVAFFDLANRLGELRRTESQALREALIAAGSQAFGAEDYPNAAQYYQRAELSGQLPSRHRRNLRTALERRGD